MQSGPAGKVALAGGLSPAQTMGMDFAALFTVGSLMAWDHARAAWPLPICYALLAVFAVRFPDLALLAGSLFLPASSIVFLVAWNRAVRQRAQLIRQ